MYARSIALALVATAFTFNQARAAETVTAAFHPVPGVSLNYGSFGYTDDEGNYQILTDQQIVSTRILIDFTPAPGLDPLSFIAAMVVPTDSVNQFLVVEGTDLTVLPNGVWHYEATTNDFNGIIRSGRFSVDCYAVDPATGDPLSISGDFSDESGFFFTVVVPEPTTLSCFALTPLLSRKRFVTSR